MSVANPQSVGMIGEDNKHQNQLFGVRAMPEIHTYYVQSGRDFWFNNPPRVRIKSVKDRVAEIIEECAADPLLDKAVREELAKRRRK